MRKTKPNYIEPYLWDWRCELEKDVKKGGEDLKYRANQELLELFNRLFFFRSMPSAWREINKRKSFSIKRNYAFELERPEDIEGICIDSKELQRFYDDEVLKPLIVQFVRCYEYHRDEIGKINYEKTLKLSKRVEQLSIQLKVALKQWRNTHLMVEAWMRYHAFDITSEQAEIYRKKDKNDCLDLPETLERIARVSTYHQSMMNRHVIGVTSKRYVAEHLLKYFCFSYGEYLYGTTASFASVILGEAISIEYVKDIAKQLGKCSRLYCCDADEAE